MADLFYLPAFKKMGIDKKKVVLMSSPLIGFRGEQVFQIGVITFLVMAGTTPKQLMVDFIVIDHPSTYNAIIGRPTLNQLKTIPSTVHLMMKFPTKHWVGLVRGGQEAARLCYNATLKEPNP